MKSVYTKIYTVIAVLFTVVFIVYINNRSFTAQIKQTVSDDTYLAFLLMVSLFAIKSFIPIFSAYYLYLITGHLFDNIWIAFAVCFSGMFCTHTFPYLLGLIDGAKMNDKLTKKYSWAKRICTMMKKRQFLNTLTVRLSVFQGDIVSLLCGTMRIEYIKYITASLIGSMPGIISITLLGKSISDPSSPLFIVSILLTLSTTAFSYAIYSKTDISDEKRIN